MNVYKLKRGIESLDSLTAGSSAFASVCLFFFSKPSQDSDVWLRGPSPSMNLDKESSRPHFTPSRTLPDVHSFLSRTNKLHSSSRRRLGRESPPIAAQTALYRVGAPIVELLGVNL